MATNKNLHHRKKEKKDMTKQIGYFKEFINETTQCIVEGNAQSTNVAKMIQEKT